MIIHIHHQIDNYMTDKKILTGGER